MPDVKKRARIQISRKVNQSRKPENEQEMDENVARSEQQFVNPQKANPYDSDAAIKSQTERETFLSEMCENLNEQLKNKDEKLKEKEEWKRKFTDENENRIQDLLETIQKMTQEKLEGMKSIEEKDSKILEQKKQIIELEMLNETKMQALIKENEDLSSLLTEEKKKNEKFTAPLSTEVIQKDIFFIFLVFFTILSIA